MKFCPKCENMFYLRVSKDNENVDRLSYICRFCNFENVAESDAMIQVLNTHVNHRKVNLNHIVNKYTKYDPTLPVMENAICPREECVKSEGPKGRILYIRYDEEKLKYLYLCTKCDNYSFIPVSQSTVSV